MEKTKTFPEGLIVKRSENAPEFVIASLSFKVEEFKAFLGKHANGGWVNIDVKRSREGKLYSELNNWSANGAQKFSAGVRDDFKKTTVSYPKEDIEVSEIPF